MALALLGCPAPPAAPTSPAAIPPSTSTAAAAAEPRFTLVESFPAETTLDHPDIPEAAAVWLEMIRGAKTSVNLSEFYVTSRAGASLEPILAALVEAASRGVKVRLLVDAKFAKNEHETLNRLEHDKRLEVRRYDVGRLMGGVQHAKYFVVDGREAYVGSQNLDWRSLSHIQELGVRLAIPEIARAELDVFETDWSLAGGADASTRTHRATSSFPVPIEGGLVTPVFSPTGWLPDESLWELPRIVALIDGAQRTVRVQLLTYTTEPQGAGERFDELDAALRRAGERGVKVELLVSDWAKSKGALSSLKELARSGKVAVRFIAIPEASTGFVPYARVAHAKYMVVDGKETWIGSSNWERRYFFSTRNAGVVVEGARTGERLDRFFSDGWNSAYAAPLDVDAEYAPPRTH